MSCRLRSSSSVWETGDQLARMLTEAEPLDQSTVWFRAGHAIAGGNRVAAQTSSATRARTDEAHIRVLAAEQLVTTGRRTEADAQLGAALAFFRSVGATRSTREADVLLAQPA